ncbi:1-(5-phosphoribosyl)-5-((5-phosphoribosylamino) methylideneamino) imidazole-4-carboxamide isomerase [Novimethylophilus kurashikiensis]|uniref:1-(5-phosphoribosyl)-5-((5-phosphoribosylamino) methylideneamino) imidazole-4-carboxamide isomerase n=1 Tax=Novimethylophilus kurashikiensis TaxID=1825523 RepID=A0A2R5FCS1_9PROT|nr:hypothetical protein [Novimethylophilus kurashikiensis]GBG14733.1 1-(5-phosphoribosyl)-5-((5-phosphoribosylamino) methylideneamino) imidazole-4-carboxamide isomerase [Novimethylophilus kurashikiensis]
MSLASNLLKRLLLIYVFFWVSFSFASQSNESKCVPNLRADLPDGIQSQIKKTDGVESYERLEIENLQAVDGELFNPIELENSKTSLIAAVILPVWYFCPSPLGQNRDAPRKLVFWKERGATWLKIGSNDQAFWPIILAGTAKASLNVEDEMVVYTQESYPVHSIWLDRFYFAYDPPSSRIVLVRWDSASHYNPAEGNSENSHVLMEAEEILGEVSGTDGYEGTFDFNSGVGEIIKYRFAERPVKVELQRSIHKMYIENMPKNMSFDGFDKFEFGAP